MKRLASIFAFAALSLLSLSPALAANRYQATVTVTNTPTQGLTLTVNGDTRTWTTNSPSATQISIGANQSASASNLFTAITGNGFPGPLAVGQLVTNQVRLIAQPGIALTASLTDGWASLAIVTNAASVATPVTVPISAELTADSRTNIASQIIAGVNSYATNRFLLSTLPAGTITNITGSADINSVFSLGVATLSVSNSSALFAITLNNGAALTNLNATAISSGTLADARLSANVTLLGSLIQLGTESDLSGTSLTNLNVGSVYGVLAIANGGSGSAVEKIPLSFSIPINTINGGSNWITLAHAVVPDGKTVTINHVQSLTDGGSDPGTNQVVRIYDVSNAQTLLATNGNWNGAITITNAIRWYARFENNSTTNINASVSIHGNLK